MAERNDAITHERQVELRTLAMRIVAEHLPRDYLESRFVLDSIEEILGFLVMGEYRAMNDKLPRALGPAAVLARPAALAPVRKGFDVSRPQAEHRRCSATSGTGRSSGR
jgi:hypothetical protein